MALNIRNRDTEAAVRRLAAVTGVGLTEAVDLAVRAQLASRETGQRAIERRRERVAEMSAWLVANVDRDAIRTDDELYDEAGLPR